MGSMIADYRYSRDFYGAKADKRQYGLSETAGFLALPKELRPREKLLREGLEAMSDRDLLCILLNTGIKGKNVSILAEELLNKLDRNKDIPSIKELSEIVGLGVSKATAVAAMLELGRRRWGLRETKVRSPKDAYSLIRHYADRRQELFLCISLNGAHEVLQYGWSP